MKVVDLRPIPVKVALRLWRNSAQTHLHIAEESGRFSPAGLYGRLLDRIMSGRVQRRPVPPKNRPFLLSIGNLALGGTGKTPVVGALARDLSARGLKGAILTRGFGSDLPGPLVVQGSNPRAGDEARWHAAQLVTSDWTVVQARNRSKGLRFLLESTPDLDVVLIEDGHQTAGLTRHLDLLILDNWTSQNSGAGETLVPRTGPVFPFGPWRESAAGANRAGILLVETGRGNSESSPSDSKVPDQASDGRPVATFERRLSLRHCRVLGDSATMHPNWAGLSGIAHPETFEKSAARIVGTPPALMIRCGDHVRYTRHLVQRILQMIKRDRAEQLVTTAKDWVKLEALWPDDIPVVVADLEILWGIKNTLPDLIEERVESLSPLP